MAPPNQIAVSRFGTIAGVNTFAHLPKELFDRAWDPIFYPVDFLALAANAQAVPVPVQIDPTKDFVCVQGFYTATSDGAPQTFVSPAAYTISITGSGGINLIGQVQGNNGVAHIDQILNRSRSTASPFRVAWYIPKGTTLTTLLTNLDNTKRDVRISYEGFSVY